MESERLKRYAALVVQVGVNVQKDQEVVIRTPIEGAELARYMTECAYEIGAKKVYVEYSDEEISRLTYHYASEETLSTFPAWETQKYEAWVERNAAFISISASNPDLLKEIPPQKLSAAQRASGAGLTKFRKAVSGSEVCWCVVAMPTPAWSKKVFPDAANEKEAQDMLWDKIFKVTRIDEEDPVSAWKLHTKKLAEKCKVLNEKKIKTLHYVAPGTDLYVELPEAYVWEGGGEYSQKGTYFVANMPTEEVFTMPYKYGVNGTLKATKPLVYAGNLIEDFSFVFKEGKIISYEAKVGKELLGRLIETDEGAAYLGEVAIVPQSCPVAQTQTLFYNTLFDENASCHFAIGSSYPTNIKGGTSMTDKELEAAGANISITHNDFMIGSNELSIEAETRTGEKFYILKNGEWVI